MRRFSDRCGERLQPPPGNSGLQSYVDAGRSATNGFNDRTICLPVETRNGGAALGRRMRSLCRRSLSLAHFGGISDQLSEIPTRALEGHSKDQLTERPARS